MSRNMIAANQAIFSSLDEYCSIRGEVLSNAGQPRWIQSTHSGRRFLMQARLVEQLSFSPSARLARFDLSSRAYFFAAGFEVYEPPKLLQVEAVDGGTLTAFLAELKLTPFVSIAQVRNVVEVADKASTPDYAGHDPALIAGLYPNVQAFALDDLAQEESFKWFFLLCLCAQRRPQWLDDRLTAKLKSLAELSSLSIPYETLCRSILDMDPSSVFLSLYRCLEAIYAQTHTERLKAALKVVLPWTDLASKLEETLGWYPREEPSLESLLRYAEEANLEATASALNEPPPHGAHLPTFVAKRIYDLRNTVVHYRPFQRATRRDVDWNRVCECLAVLVFDIYAKVTQDAPVVRDGAN